MAFLALPVIGTVAFDPSSFLATHPDLAYEVAGHGLAHAIHSYIERSGRRHGMSRHEMRKAVHRRQRWFVDNIIMHHRRLAERNRQIIINNSRTRIIAKKEKAKQHLELQRGDKIEKSDRENEFRSRWNSAFDLKERGKRIRGTIDVRRQRSRSRWLSVLESKKLH